MDDHLDVLVSIAQDLTTAPSAGDRYQRLLASLSRVIAYDAAALLRLEDGVLVPVAARGLTPSALARRFARREHPRLDVVCGSQAPVFFPADTKLPDPFDGLLLEDRDATHRIHACLGCPLLIHGELLGVLTADARDPDAFASIDVRCLTAVAALAAAELRTTQLIEALERSAERQGLIARDLMREAAGMQAGHIIGASAVMAHLREELELVARSEFTVLVTGETGVGKELVARAIHDASGRRSQPLIHVNCAALPETLAESELFGHLRGAFTGATADRPGKFEVADGGTLFLDEIGELPLVVQSKLLRVLQQGELQRVGADRVSTVDVRVVAATNRDLEEEIRAGRFRADLYHRLKVYPLHVPALRERREDVPLLAGYFCDVARRRLGTGPVRLTADAAAALAGSDWPGNVRELENVISRVVLQVAARARRGEPVVISRTDLGPELAGAGAGAIPAAPPPEASATAGRRSLSEAVREYQRELIGRALADGEGSWAEAARLLGMDRGNLHHLARRLGMTRPAPRPRSRRA